MPLEYLQVYRWPPLFPNCFITMIPIDCEITNFPCISLFAFLTSAYSFQEKSGDYLLSIVNKTSWSKDLYLPHKAILQSLNFNLTSAVCRATLRNIQKVCGFTLHLTALEHGTSHWVLLNGFKGQARGTWSSFVVSLNFRLIWVNRLETLGSHIDMHTYLGFSQTLMELVTE